MPTEAQEARGELLGQTDSSVRVSMAEAGAGGCRRVLARRGAAPCTWEEAGGVAAKAGGRRMGVLLFHSADMY